MQKNIQAELISLVSRALSAGKFPGPIPALEEISLDLPTDSRFGDFTTNVALKLSKLLKQPPREIAAIVVELIQKEILKSELKDLIAQVKVEGAGFVNFYLEPDYFYTQLNNILTRGKDALKLD
ncbi:MAG: hypothetical protein PHU59_06240, partial [Candidatus Omnitrophica bacterium]|nr:hypothetical protein [Candidatus Omnitrophota bacterium]